MSNSLLNFTGKACLEITRLKLFPNFDDLTAEGIITLQVLNQASWQETFLALWLSALRLVQRVEMNPSMLIILSAEIARV